MSESGDTKDDLTLPGGTDDLEKLAIQIKDDFDAGKELTVSVLAVSSIYKCVYIYIYIYTEKEEEQDDDGKWGRCASDLLFDTYIPYMQTSFSSIVLHCIDSRLMRKKKRSTIKCLATRC